MNKVTWPLCFKLRREIFSPDFNLFNQIIKLNKLFARCGIPWRPFSPILCRSVSVARIFKYTNNTTVGARDFLISRKDSGKL